MRILSTLIFICAFGSCRAQTDTIDTIRRGVADYLYENGRLIETIYYAGDKVDIRVIYLYKDGLLVRREWWKGGKRISYTIDG